MDSKKIENVDAKAEFRKLSNDTASRNYRRRSPVSGSPHSDRSSSPVPSTKDNAKVTSDKQKMGDSRDLGRDPLRGRYSRTGEPYEHSDYHSSKSSSSHHRRDEYNRRERNVDEYDRDYSKSSSRSGRASRDYHNSDRLRHEHQHGDSSRGMGKCSEYKSDSSRHKYRDKEEDSFEKAESGRRYANIKNIEAGNGERDRDRNRHKEDGNDRNGKADNQRSSGAYRSNRLPAYEEPKGLKNDSSSRRDGSGHHPKEAAKRDTKELGGEMDNKGEKRHYSELGESLEKRKTLSSKDQESLSKKPNLYSLGPAKDATCDEKQSSTSKQTQDAHETVTKQTYVTDSDIDAARTAAMKAAELVNRNLIGTGYVSADQKKKLLWGNKKNMANEESAHHWDVSTFGDRERQEKFNKLMSLRLPWYIWPIVGGEKRVKGRAQTRQPRHGEAAGTAPAGFGEAIHCWTAPTRWSNSWTWSLKAYFSYSRISSGVFCFFSYCDCKIFCRTLHFYLKAVCGSLIPLCKVAIFAIQQAFYLKRSGASLSRLPFHFF